MGSSPLTRGKRQDAHGGDIAVGLIPAHAGKTALVIGVLKARGAHPRSRGENGTHSDLAYVTEGSSPLTRGKLDFAHVVLAVCGLIPAHAGKTALVIGVLKARGAHPRSRGENGTHSDLAYVTEGSSPLTRGKLDFAHVVLAVCGLIPAHAGKTS